MPEHDRRNSDMLLQRILATQTTILNKQEEILEKLNIQKGEHDRLVDKVDRIDEDLRGPDGKGGLTAKVETHGDRINQAVGGAAILGSLGLFIGWSFDRIVKSLQR